MTSQKEALKNLMQGMSWDYKLLLVSNWLEDINWHKENHELMQTYKFRNQIKMQIMETINYITHEYNYAHQFIEELKEHLNKTGEMGMYQEALLDIRENGRSFIKGQMIDSQDLYEYARTMWYSPFSYMFGWGINTKDWTSEGSGTAFVKELYELINQE